jgi:menaquinone-9 beta-reductase
LALRLAEPGLRIALLDRSTFPRRKVCGEGLSGCGVSMLKEIGVDVASELPHNPYSEIAVWSRDRGATIRLSSGALEQGGLGVRREILDMQVLQRALQQSGVSGFLGHRVTRVEREGGVFTVTTEERTFRAPHLAFADGPASMLSQQLGVPVLRTARNRFGLQVLLEGEFLEPEPRRVNVLLQDGWEIYVTPVSPTQLTVCLLTSCNKLAAIRAASQWRSIIGAACDKALFRGYQVGKVRGIGPLGRRIKPSWWRGTYLIGDAVESLDPIAGMGMTHALLSSKLAAQSLRAALCGELSADAAGRRYHIARESEIKPIRGFTRLTYHDLTRMAGLGLYWLGNTSIPAALGRSVYRTTPPVAWGERFVRSALALAGT